MTEVSEGFPFGKLGGFPMKKHLLIVLSVVMAARANAATYPANHCEGFIDKARPVFFSQSSGSMLTVYVKTLNERLDSPIRAVGFTGYARVCISCNVSESGGAIVDKPLSVGARPFVGASNYFELTLPVGTYSDRDATIGLTGEIYVLTERGTRYLLTNPSEQTELDLDGNLTHALSGVYDRLGVKSYGDVGQLPKTADLSQQGFSLGSRLNPDQCR